MIASSMLKSGRDFISLLASEKKFPIGSLTILMAISSLSEGFGITLLVPILSLLQKNIASASAPHYLQYILQHIDAAYAGIVVLCLFLILQAVKFSSQCLRENTSNQAQCDLVDRLREQCYRAIVHSEWNWLSQRNNADYSNMLLTDINRIGTGVSFFLLLVSAFAQLIVYSIAALFLSWHIALLVFGIGGIFFLVGGRLRRESLYLGSSLGIASKQIHGVVQESLLGIKLVKILGNENQHLLRFLQSMDKHRAHLLNFQRSSSIFKAKMQFVGTALLVCILYIGLEVWHLPLAKLAVLIFVFSRMMPLVSQIQQNLHQWLHSLPALTSLNQLIADCKNAAEPQADGTSMQFQHSMQLQNIEFQYASRDQQALHQINLNIPAKSTTAIIGQSGAGKSTLADILMGLLRPDSGRILIDNIELNNESRLQWRNSVAYVPQEPILFSDSIKNNLLWAAPKASDQDLWIALEKAAANFVLDLPKGLDTLVGDQGLRLSGGERQRIALARALLRRPAMIILDEATSALDIENEKKISAAISNLHGDVTVVAIGHRMATLEHADQVIVIENGCVIQSGTWEEIKKVN